VFSSQVATAQDGEDGEFRLVAELGEGDRHGEVRERARASKSVNVRSSDASGGATKDAEHAKTKDEELSTGGK